MTMTSGSVRFGRAAPTIPVGDIDRALTFYRDVLDLQVTFTNGEPIGFVILKKDLAEIHLTRVAPYKAGPWNVAHLLVSDAASLFDRCVQSGARIIKRLRDQEYGLRDFVVADPFGNRIDIGQRLVAD
jgi:catechol 2,3-dioxygenase-like lactoylglutathione lyase family enzyme